MESLEQWKVRELRGGGGVTVDLVLSEAAMIGAGVCVPEGGAQGSQMDHKHQRGRQGSATPCSLSNGVGGGLGVSRDIIKGRAHQHQAWWLKSVIPTH